MFEAMVTAVRYMQQSWDKGTTIAACALGVTVLVQLVQPYFSNSAENATKLEIVIDNQNEFKETLLEERREEMVKDKENLVAHEATRTRVTIVEQGIIALSNRFSEVVTEIKGLSSKIDRLQRARRDNPRENPYADAYPQR